MNSHISTVNPQGPVQLPARSFDSILLAGDRTRNDPLHSHSGTTSKALAPINGMPMIHHVIHALRSAETIGSINLCGPDQANMERDATLVQWIHEGLLTWQPPQASPSRSTYRMLSTMPEDRPTMVTTADHPLLSSEIIERFCQAASTTTHDVVVGMTPHGIVRSSYPDVRKTVLRFSDDDYCGCNLFAFMTPEGRQVAEFWQRIENQRKKPLLLIRLLGWLTVIRYRLGLLSLNSALTQISHHLDLDIGVVVLPYANATVDVDSVSDYQHVEGYVRAQEARACAQEQTRGAEL